MIIAGIDYSLRCPAVCVFEGDLRFHAAKCTFHFLSTVKKYTKSFSNNINGYLLKEHKHECERYDQISEWTINLVKNCDYVCVEDYAFAAKGKVFHIGENTGILKHKMWSQKISYKTVPPTQIKKFATGRGNAKKEDMYTSFITETKLDLLSLLECKSKQIKSPISDLADSYYICKYAHKIFNDNTFVT